MIRCLRMLALFGAILLSVHCGDQPVGTDLDVAVPPPPVNATVSLTVLGVDSAPLPNAKVSLSNSYDPSVSSDEDRFFLSQQTDSLGQVRFDEIRFGLISASVEAPTQAGGETVEGELRLGNGPDEIAALDVTIQIPENVPVSIQAHGLEAYPHAWFVMAHLLQEGAGHKWQMMTRSTPNAEGICEIIVPLGTLEVLMYDGRDIAPVTTVEVTAAGEHIEITIPTP